MSHLIFTLDFHEMIRGKLKQNENCSIDYDPLRLAASLPGYIHGSPEFEFTAHLQFEPKGSQDIRLRSVTGLLENPVVMNDGRGSMLSGDFIIPGDAEEIIVWISLKDNLGKYTYDSDFGRNFHFRIIDQDIQVTKAAVSNNKTAGTAAFTIETAATDVVSSVLVRYRVTNGDQPLKEIPIELKRGKIVKKKQTWITGPIEVSYNAVVTYDLIYSVGKEKFKVENNGNYFIASTGK